MKALSIKQPWVDFILSGRKTIETRMCSTRHRGLPQVHRWERAATPIKFGDLLIFLAENVMLHNERKAQEKLRGES